MAVGTILLTLAAAFVLAYAISRWRADQARRVHERLTRWRGIVRAAVLILLAATFVQSGNPVLIGVTVVLVIVVALYVAVEQPHRDAL